MIDLHCNQINELYNERSKTADFVVRVVVKYGVCKLNKLIHGARPQQGGGGGGQEWVFAPRPGK